MTWTDWAALIVGLTFFLVLLFLLLIDFIAAGNIGTSHLIHSLGAQAVELNLFIAGFVWAFLRTTEYLIRASYRLLRVSFKRVTSELARVLRPEASIRDIEKVSACQ